MILHFARVKYAGFTLIEIMIVIAIIAILAGIVIPNIVMARFEANCTACQENCKTGLLAVQMARVRHTWQQVADMLDGGRYDVNTTYASEHCYGYLGSKFVESGYLAKPLRCPAGAMGNANEHKAYYFDHIIYRHYGEALDVYRDYRCTEESMIILHSGGTMVECSGSHCLELYYIEAIPCYEENVGACFQGW